MRPKPVLVRDGLPWAVSGSLVAGAVALGTIVEITLHELGHLIVDRVLGADASIALHPFEPSGTAISGPLPEGYGWAVAAGPVAPIVLGSILAIFAWRHRRPGLLAIILLGPLALLLEGGNALVQLIERADGTDMTLLSELGVPVGVLGSSAALAVVAGLGSMSAAMAAAGLGPDVGPAVRWAAPVFGFSFFPLLGLIWVAVNNGEISRNLGLTLFGIVTGLTVAALHPGIIGRTGLRQLDATPETAFWVWVAAASLIGLMLLIA